jgi:hypothetical protein
MAQRTVNNPPFGWRTFGKIVDDITELFGLVDTNYKTYNALLNQSGGSAPVSTILLNTLSGTPVYASAGPGVYTITLHNEFIQDKTTITIGPGNSSGVIYGWEWNSKNMLTIFSLNSSGTKVDNLFSNTTIEIKVYN